MTNPMSDKPDDRIVLALADSFTSEGTREALQVIADSILVVAGFGTAVLNVLTDTDEFEAVAVAGADMSYVGTRNPRALVMSEIADADDWGRFKYAPEDRQARVTPHTIIPDVDYGDAPDAWHPWDLLMAPLYYDNGDLCGLLSIDQPPGGVIPDPEMRAVLNRYAEHAERAMVNALQRDRLNARLRLAEATRTVIRQASAFSDVRNVLQASRAAMLEGLDATGVWLYAADGRDITDVVVAGGKSASTLPRDVTDDLANLAREYWARRTVVDVTGRGSAERERRGRKTDVGGDILIELGLGPSVLVPIGAGDQLLGYVLLSRDAEAPQWSHLEALAISGIGSDIGQALLNAHLLQRERQLSARLQELDAYKSQLISTMAHELKTPIAIVALNVELALVELDRSGGTTKQIAGRLAAIDRGTARLNALSSNLLLLSRSERLPENDRTSDLASGVLAAVEALALQIDAQQVQVQLEVTPVSVQAAPEDLEAISINLLSNAVKYGGTGGRVWVETDTILRGDARWGRLSVRDEGPGLLPGEHERVFEEFYRSPLWATKTPGTGLGLAIVKRLVERIGGDIDVVSPAGGGSMFVVLFPLKVGGERS